MEVILLENIENLGDKFSTVKVKAGYGRNFLIPKKKAIIANAQNKSIVGERLRQVELKESKILDELNAIIEKINQAAIKVSAKVGTSGKIFGSVTNVQLAEAIKKATGEEIDRKKIEILDEIKELGTFKAKIDLHSKVKPEIDFEVVAG